MTLAQALLLAIGSLVILLAVLIVAIVYTMLGRAGAAMHKRTPNTTRFAPAPIPLALDRPGPIDFATFADLPRPVSSLEHRAVADDAWAHVSDKG